MHDRALSSTFFSASESEVVPSPLLCTGPFTASGAYWVTRGWVATTGPDASGLAARAALPMAPLPAPPLDTGKLRGSVHRKGSRGPLVDAQVKATSATGRVAKVETDRGEFELSLPCGPHAVVVAAPGYSSISLSRDPCL